MITMPQIVNSAIAAGALVLTATAAFAQSDELMPDDISRGSIATCLFRLATRAGCLLLKLRSPSRGNRRRARGTEQRAVARCYRNREGRVRG